MGKSLCIFLALFFFTLCEVPALQAQMGIRAGINFSTMTGHNVGASDLNVNINMGFHAGVLYDIVLSDYFFIQPGLLFSTKGFSEKGVPGNDNYTFKKTGYYAELPINLIYKPSLGNGHLLVGAGPYFGYGLGGKWTNEGTINTKGNVVFVNDFNEYDNGNGKNMVYGKRRDYGINVLFGYEFSNRIFAQLNGQHGLMDITPLKDGEILDLKQNNVQFGVSLGYKF